MAKRVKHSTSIVGVVTVTLDTGYYTVAVVNWGTVPLYAVASTLPSVTDPAVGADDVDIIPVGATVNISVQGPPYDPGQSGTINAGTTVKVVAGTASSGFSVVGLGS